MVHLEKTEPSSCRVLYHHPTDPLKSSYVQAERGPQRSRVLVLRVLSCQGVKAISGMACLECSRDHCVPINGCCFGESAIYLRQM